MKIALKIFISGIVSLVILSIIVCFISYSGVHVNNESGATDYKWEKNQYKSTIFEGFAWLRFDNQGFNNAIDKQEYIDLLLMGSSHMEAYNVASDENVGYLLNKSLSKYYTYNIGISGHTLYSCIYNLEAALSYYQPRKYVVIETATIELEKEDMQTVINGTYRKIPSYDTGIMYKLQKELPAIKSLYKCITDWKNEGNIVVEQSQKTEEDVYSGEEYNVCLQEFLSKAGCLAKEYGIQLVIFYHPTESIDSEGKYLNHTNQDALNAFSDACRDNDICFIDMTNDFGELYETQYMFGHGFVNTSVGSGHLNKYGHKVIADRLVKEIEGEANDTK